MAKKYRSPILLDEVIETPPAEGTNMHGGFNNIREMKDDLSTSFVYGDDHYEEEYVVPDIVEEVIVSDSEEAGE